MPHDLESAYQLTANDILDVISRSPRCEQMVKGFVAEYHLELRLKALQEKGLLTYERTDSDGQPDFKVVSDGRTLLVECKNVMTYRYSNGDYKIDFQRTRISPPQIPCRGTTREATLTSSPLAPTIRTDGGTSFTFGRPICRWTMKLAGNA